MGAKRFGRLTVMLSTGVWALLHGASVALAQYPGGTTTPTPTTTVGGEQFQNPGPLPGTGAKIMMAVLVAAVLLFIGIALHRLSRRANPGDS